MNFNQWCLIREGNTRTLDWPVRPKMPPPDLASPSTNNQAKDPTPHDTSGNFQPKPSQAVDQNAPTIAPQKRDIFQGDPNAPRRIRHSDPYLDARIVKLGNIRSALANLFHDIYERQPWKNPHTFQAFQNYMYKAVDGVGQSQIMLTSDESKPHSDLPT